MAVGAGAHHILRALFKMVSDIARAIPDLGNDCWRAKLSGSSAQWPVWLMDEFFASGRAVDVVLAVLAIEMIWLKLRGSRWADIVPALLPAALMMIALRAALVGMAWPYVSIPLALAFPVHLYDLRRRGMPGSRRRGS